MPLQQLPLFAYPMICCSSCGAIIRDLNDLRAACSKSNGGHLVATGEYFALYRLTESASLTANTVR